MRSARNNSPRNFEFASFANQAKSWRANGEAVRLRAQWNNDSLDPAKEVRRGNSHYIRTISPYPHNICTISERYPKRTSAVRPCGIRAVFVRRLYGILRTSGIWDVRIPYLQASHSCLCSHSRREGPYPLSRRPFAPGALPLYTKAHTLKVTTLEHMHHASRCNDRLP